ncbi:hypothetical protein GQ53DRAFT_752010 [Thozetella sp. PMI_491]|nr:hypothetical protein GQ53DRAFT_752010 [Thozetella sp. PMI_491]
MAQKIIWLNQLLNRFFWNFYGRSLRQRNTARDVPRQDDIPSGHHLLSRSQRPSAPSLHGFHCTTNRETCRSGICAPMLHGASKTDFRHVYIPTQVQDRPASILARFVDQASLARNAALGLPLPQTCRGDAYENRALVPPCDQSSVRQFSGLENTARSGFARRLGEPGPTIGASKGSRGTERRPRDRANLPDTLTK